MTELASDYLNEIRRQLRGHKRMAESAMAQLEDTEFFTAIDPESMSYSAPARSSKSGRPPDGICLLMRESPLSQAGSDASLR